MRKPEIMLFCFIMATVSVWGQAWSNVKLGTKSSSGLKSECAGNLLRLSLDKVLAVGNQLEVEAINGSQHVVLTPSLAAQCGYSMESDPWGNTRIYASLLGCYVNNKADSTFTVGLRLQMYKQTPSEVISHDVAQTCSYTRWASREILCERNYMEASTRLPAHGIQPAPKGQAQTKEDSTLNAIPDASGGHGIWKMTFFTPEAVTMVLEEAEQAGYGAMTTSSRLVMRSPYSTAETYHEDVAGVPMEVFRVSVYHKAKQGLNVINLAAACPKGGVLFTEDLISWHVPRRVSPLTDGKVKVVELHMGINGQKLDKAQMAARGYKLITTDLHIVEEIPVGSPDGYYKSHAPDYQYHITYNIEPMLEVLWKAETSQEDTRYKVLFPITTPPMARPPQAVDYTIAENRVFNVHVGTFLHDVELRNITFSTGVLTIDECTARGFVVEDHALANGTIIFSLQVPFDSDVVLTHNPEPLVTTYTLPLVFGFVIHPELTTFAHSVEVAASLHDVVLPVPAGTCDQENFYVTVKFGTMHDKFATIIGSKDWTPELAKEFNYQENQTHLSIVVPYAADVTAFEVFTTNFVRTRLDILLYDRINNWVLGDLYLACNFPLLTTACYPNGTISAMAIKVESVPNLDPSWLTLRDQSCRPSFSSNRFAQFTFNADSCGTTVNFFGHYMMYENEISLYYNSKVAHKSPVDPTYRQTISCYYTVNETQSISFTAKPRQFEPKAEIGAGYFMVQLRLSQDHSYNYFYQAEDYPVEKSLRQPVYFEVELQSRDVHLEVILENCWATREEDPTSVPNWDIIVDGCANPDDGYATVFHPVVMNERVSVPAHIKRFSMKMFTFIQDNIVLKDEIYVHCDVVICDQSGPAAGICKGQCSHPTATKPSKKGARGQSKGLNYQQISSGPIMMKSHS